MMRLCQRWLLGIICGWGFAVVSNSFAAPPDFEQLLVELSSKDGDVRFLANLKLGHDGLDPARAVVTLAHQLNQNDSSTRLVALPSQAALIHWGPKAASVLLTELKSGDVERQKFALHALQFVSSQASDAEVVELSTLLIPHALRNLHPSHHVSYARTALSRMGAKAIPHIERAALATRNTDEQETLVQILGWRPMGVSSLLRLMQSDQPGLHAAVADLLPRMYESDREQFLPVVPQFLELLATDSNSKYWRDHGREALNSLGPNILPQVAEFFRQTKSAPAKVNCIRVMTSLAVYRTLGPYPKRTSPNAKDLLLEILVLASKDRAEEVRLAVMHPLETGYAKEVYQPVFREFIRDEFPSVRLAMIERIVDPKPYLPELTAAKTDPDAEVRDAAKKTLLKEPSGFFCPGVWDAPPTAMEKGLRWLVSRGDCSLYAGNRTDDEHRRAALMVLCHLGAGTPPAPPNEEPHSFKESYPATYAMPHLLARVIYEGSDNSTAAITARATATLAICEAYCFTDDQSYRRAAELAVKRLIAIQSSKSGGWGEDNLDCSLWAVLALRSASAGQIEVPLPVLEKAEEFFSEKSGEEDLPAEVLVRKALGRLACEREPTSELSSPAVLWAPKTVRELRSKLGSDTAYFARLLLAWQPEGALGERTDYKELWQKNLQDELSKTQVAEGREEGSWDDTTIDTNQEPDRLRATIYRLLTSEVNDHHTALARSPLELVGFKRINSRKPADDLFGDPFR